MPEILTAPTKNQTYEQSQRYFSFQIKGWTNFDLKDNTLAEIAEAIEQGGGFLTLIEVLKVEDDLASVGDAKRLMRVPGQAPYGVFEADRKSVV